MKRINQIILPLLFACLSSHAALTPDQLFPEDCVVYLEFSDIARMSERWKESPAVKQWKSDEFSDIREWVMKEGPLAEIFDDAADDPAFKAMKDSLHLYQGSFAVGVLESKAWLKAIHDEMKEDEAALLEDFDLNAPLEELEELEAREEPDNPADNPAFIKHLVFVAEMLENEAKIRKANVDMINELIAREVEQGAKSSLVERKIDGVDVLVHRTAYEGKNNEDFTAYIEGLEVSTGSEAALRMMIDHIRRGSAPQPLAGNRDYARAKSQAENRDILVHVNLNLVGQYIHNQLADDAEPNPLLGISMAQLAHALELDAVAPITATLEMQPKGIAFRTNLGFTRPTRLSKVFLPYAQEKFSRPDFIPNDVVSVNSARVEFATWWDSIMGLVGALSPQLGMTVNMILLESQEEMGFDLKNDFINAIGNEVIYAQKMSMSEKQPSPAITDGQSTLVGLKVKNRAAIERVIRKISTMMAPAGGGELMEMEEFLGHKIHSVSPGLPVAEGGAPTIAYTFIDDYIVIGVGVKDLVKSAIRAARSPEQSIWNTPDMKRALAMVPGDTPWFEFGRIDQVFKVMGSLIGGELISGLEPGAEPDEEEADLPDMNLLSKLIGQAVNTSYLEQQRVFTQGFLLYPVEE